jgi:hypothetical protein
LAAAAWKVSELVLLGVGILKVADRPLGLSDVVGNTFVTLGAETARPFDGGVGAHVGLPVRTDLGQIIREVIGRARPIRPMHVGDGLVRQLHIGIELRDRRVVPGLHFAEENLGQGRPVEHKVAGLKSLDVHHRNDTADHHGKLRQAAFIQVLAGQGRIRRAEGHGLGLDLLDAAARANRLAVEAGAGLFFYRRRPI